jgi:predicted metal-dependent HD superfamily phosphohydrolase
MSTPGTGSGLPGGGAKILREFLARSRIYSTGFFYDRFEVPARANLQRSLLRLSAGPLTL